MTGLKNRYLSLDVFRGATIALMIIVNSPGKEATTFPPLLHAEWNGFTLADLVFPTFLFVVGIAMSFSLKKYGAMGSGPFLKKVFKRTAIIFLLGFLMYWYPFFDNGQLRPFSETRVFGVLQRIALCYLFGALLVYYLRPKALLVFGVAALLAYHVILLAFGDLGLLGNAVRTLDIWLIGEAHMYHGNGGVAFDPEGLLSTLPAIVNVVAGYLAGRYVQKKGPGFETLSQLFLIGSALLVLAFAWDQVFPINKKLWSSSFVLLTTGIDLFAIAVLIYLLDMKRGGPAKWTYFFEVFGRNPLFIYLLSELFIISLFNINIGEMTAYAWIAEKLFIAPTNGYIGSLLFALWVLISCWSVGYLLDRKGVYIKV